MGKHPLVARTGTANVLPVQELTPMIMPGVPREWATITIPCASCREVVKQLSAREVTAVALVRDSAAAKKRLPQLNVEVVQGNLYQYATLPRALHGCDAVICAAASSDALDPLGPFKIDFTVRTNILK
jgi:hypothetical protein